jgi:hypothetical protein
MFIRRHLLNKPTSTEKRIATTTVPQLDRRDDSFDQLQTGQTLYRIDNLIIHYKHEARLQNYKTDIHQLWNQIFNSTPIMDTKLIIGHQNNPKIRSVLISRRPECQSSSTTIGISIPN